VPYESRIAAERFGRVGAEQLAQRREPESPFSGLGEDPHARQGAEQPIDKMEPWLVPGDPRRREFLSP
jgi:hypothetical protein